MLGLRLAMIMFIQFFAIDMNLLIDVVQHSRALFLTKMTFLAVAGLAFAAINSDQLLSQSIKSRA
jgi:hypothetical protein